jgi:hypothetical protein
MKPSKQFPPSSGWITAKLTLTKGATFTEQDAREFITFGKPHRAQFGLIEIGPKSVKIIYRETNKAAIQPDAEPVVIDFDIHAPLPFIAQCGNLIVEVNKVHVDLLPLQLIDVEILKGKYFNDRGDYGPGDEVTIGPLSEHWKILTFPDPVPA